jgi:hypothetical protein
MINFFTDNGNINNEHSILFPSNVNVSQLTILNTFNILYADFLIDKYVISSLPINILGISLTCTGSDIIILGHLIGIVRDTE